MNERDLWENQVEILTKRTAILNRELEEIASRLEYFENVVLVLISALREGGIIQPDPNGTHSF